MTQPAVVCEMCSQLGPDSFSLAYWSGVEFRSKTICGDCFMRMWGTLLVSSLLRWLQPDSVDVE